LEVSAVVCSLLSAPASLAAVSLSVLLLQALKDTPTAIIVLTIKVCRLLFHMGNVLTLLKRSKNGINERGLLPLIMKNVC
jgi:hypothetical protein